MQFNVSKGTYIGHISKQLRVRFRHASFFRASKSGQRTFLEFDALHEQHEWAFKLKWQPNQSQNNRAGLHKDITYFLGKEISMFVTIIMQSRYLVSIAPRYITNFHQTKPTQLCHLDAVDEQTLMSVLGAKHFRPFSSLSFTQNQLIGLTRTTKKWN